MKGIEERREKILKEPHCLKNYNESKKDSDDHVNPYAALELKCWVGSINCYFQLHNTNSSHEFM
jgi:hypothetical protein